MAVTQMRLPFRTTHRIGPRRAWTQTEQAIVRFWYRKHGYRGALDLVNLAFFLGSKNPQQIAKFARTQGLTETNRGVAQRRPPKDRRQFPGQSASEIARSRWRRHPHPRGMAGKHHSADTRRRLGAISRQRWRDVTEEQLTARRERMVATKVATYGHAGPSLAGASVYSRAARGRRADLDNQFFRSRWEANYARYLRWLTERGEIHNWRYEAKTFLFPYTRGCVSYLPDFEVTDQSGAIEYHEVKGWLDRKSQTKLKRMRQHHPDVRVQLIGPREYRAIAKWGQGLIPGWEA